ncbi:MAG: hypothetical protein KIT45_10110 [Fimbriimonadia bacterium]|nr:hypothetical protein [Fimbriimonadia bacterium]
MNRKLWTCEGVYRNGQIELLETPDNVEEARVFVTFLPLKLVELSEHGIDEQQAADLRARLKTFSEDWERPDMDVYDAM